MSGIQRNIPALIVIKLSKWLMLYMPFVALFYSENNLSKEYIFYLHAIYSVCIVVFEVPSGYIADVIGRKNSLLAGAILGFLGFTIYSVSYGLTGFIIAELVLGIGQSFISGSDSAMLYDSMIDLKKADKYLKYEGRITAIGNYAESLAAIIAAFLIFGQIRTIYYFQSAIAFTAIPAAILLIEPTRHQLTSTGKWRNLLNIIHHSIFKDKLLRNYILLSSFIGAATLSMAWFAQLIFIEIGIKDKNFAFLWAFLNIVVGLGSWSAHKLKDRFGLKITSLIIVITIPVLFMLTGQILNYFVLIVLTLFYMVRGIATPVLKNAINEIISSDRRATVLSIRSLIIRIVYSILAPLIGVITHQFSLRYALTLSGFIFFVASLIIYLSFLGVLKKEKLKG